MLGNSIVIAVIYTVVGYVLRMIVVNHKTQVYERAVNKCNKSRAKFFIYGGENAREEWVKDAKNERDQYDKMTASGRTKA